ncbi:MAG: carbamoyltransferase [Bacteroidia bacterium]|nr:carbamoyltransferase [Bacteroidia bacterium]
MKVLGISAYYHDSAAALTVDGKIIAAAQEERFTRQKHIAEFPTNAIQYCLKEAALTLDELDAVVFYDKPFLKFERLIETYYAFAPKGLMSFITAIPVWLNEKLFLKRAIKKGLKEVSNYDKQKLNLLFTEHHLSHAASAFFVSPHNESAILTIDGVGEWCTASIGFGKANTITFLREMNFPHSVGLLYSAFTYYLGFAVNSGEYKLMGLAPYGIQASENVNQWVELIKTELVSIKEDGSIFLNQSYFKYATGLRMINHRKWKALFGFERRREEDELQQQHCDLALAIQKVTEEIVLKMAAEAKKITGSKNLCMAGGVALNCVSNAKLRDLNLFENIYIQPAAGDAGGALGAALAVEYLYYGAERKPLNNEDNMQGTYLGPEISTEEVEQLIGKFSAAAVKYNDSSELSKTVAAKLARGLVIGWCRGRMEFGPRALGNRSILADPRNADMQKKLNLKIKNREGFRPFAPSVLSEHAATYFNTKEPSPYMLFVSELNSSFRNPLPADYEKLDLWERLYYQRSQLPAITHLDFTARVQTVHKATNPVYWQLLDDFRIITGIPVLVNTSFNVRGEPMVCSSEDAYRCFMQTDMDVLVINNFVFEKEAQPDWKNKAMWERQFKKD